MNRYGIARGNVSSSRLNWHGFWRSSTGGLRILEVFPESSSQRRHSDQRISEVQQTANHDVTYFLRLLSETTQSTSSRRQFVHGAPCSVTLQRTLRARQHWQALEARRFTGRGGATSPRSEAAALRFCVFGSIAVLSLAASTAGAMYLSQRAENRSRNKAGKSAGSGCEAGRAASSTAQSRASS
jgi:hypothetical protein